MLFKEFKSRRRKSMKKTLIVLLMVLLCAMFIISCDGDASSSSPKATYTVTFNSNGGSNVATTEITEGEKVTKPANPTKDSCIFAKWTTDQAGKNKYDFESAVNGNITLYAQWATLPTTAGETVELGTYPDNYAIQTLREDDVTWRVLAIDNAEKRFLLISENILEKRAFDADSGDYSSSDIRSYLNDDFITNYGLSDVSICNVDVTSNIEETAVGSGSDKVFLLSKTETDNTSYFATNADLSANYNGSSVTWYLRSNSAGALYLVGSGPANLKYDYSNSSYGLRPAFWVNF